MHEAVAGLSVKDFALRAHCRDFDERIAAGEIVGLAGLDGHGQDAFLEALAGLQRPTRGEIALMSDGCTTPLSGFRRAAAMGISYLPRDRRASGIFPNLSVLDNFAIASLERDLSAFLISWKSRRRRYEAFRERLGIVAAEPDGAITRLSGGNQQKVLLARLLARDPKALLLNDPTRGVDVATRRILYKVFRELAEGGMAMAILSSEIEELIGLCDRVLVFRDYELTARLDAAGLTSEQVIAAMFGGAA
jgi:ribose transport system ATP-binding protein